MIFSAGLADIIEEVNLDTTNTLNLHLQLFIYIDVFP